MRRLITLLAALLLSLAANADIGEQSAAEIEHLINSIAVSDCTFVRNGKRHSPVAAEKHLRMKLKRGKRYVSDAESFIERLASKSSMSKKPYFIECDGAEPVPSGDWLMERLAEFRSSDQASASGHSGPAKDD
ncbi:MAG: DUF5329 domain-containing protein [Woeseiaceae bacterium]|nr:DUF5329 domain-containing protein [Woeseiaceae bacterium]